MYFMFEAMETEETTISDEKSTFLDGRPSPASAGDCDYNTSSAPTGTKLELGLSLAIILIYDLNLNSTNKAMKKVFNRCLQIKLH